jgi:acetyl-CoA C-acetyltransferase
MNIAPRTPILVGVGQIVSHWDGKDAAAAPSTLSLCRAAARSALHDTGAGQVITSCVDVLTVVRTMQDSVPGLGAAFPQCANLPRALSAELGLTPRRAIYSGVGGDQPQALVNEFAESIHKGDAQVVVLAGAEAIAAAKTAARARTPLDWSYETTGEMEDRGYGARLLSNYEIANGLGYPTKTYPIFEHALRARMGLDRDAYRRMMSKLWSGFSAVAALNPYAQFPTQRDIAFLENVSAENYAVADPYLKWHVAQDAVNQGACVIMTSVERARELGIDPAKWVYLHGYAQASDAFVTERPDLSRSRAMEGVLNRALQSAEKTIADIAEIDLYSCFPCAVLIAAEALGIDWRARTLTVTGGLPFFGGAGNNYSMHAIATMVERLRARPGGYGLVLANGGFLSKEAAGVYSTTPKEGWAPVSSADVQQAIDQAPAPQLLTQSTKARVESFTVTFDKGAPKSGYVLASAAEGRILARTEQGDRATLAALTQGEPIGQVVQIKAEGETNYIVSPGPVGSGGVNPA